MKQNLLILSAEVKEGIGKKSQQPYRMVICQCAVTDVETGELKVGELTLPKDMSVPVPGYYNAEFRVGVDYQSKKIAGVLVGLSPGIKISSDLTDDFVDVRPRGDKQKSVRSASA